MSAVTLRNRVKPLIDKMGKTPYQFWKDTGIAQKTAYRLYNDETKLPDPVVLDKICSAYRIQVGEVIYWMPGDESTVA